jgi:hypothetical protein
MLNDEVRLLVKNLVQFVSDVDTHILALEIVRNVVLCRLGGPEGPKVGTSILRLSSDQSACRWIRRLHILFPLLLAACMAFK